MQTTRSFAAGSAGAFHRLRSRRAALRGLLGGGVAIAAAGARPALAEDDALAVGEWVGALDPTTGDRPAPLLAVVAEPPPPGAAVGRMRLYLCDGAGLAEWFAGDLTGNAFALTSKGGATVEGEANGATATGILTIDGIEHAFTAKRATGVAGLYTVLEAEGLYAGASARGITFAFGMDAEGQLTGVFLQPNGESDRVAARRATLDVLHDAGAAVGASRVIVHGNLPEPLIAGVIAPRTCRDIAVKRTRALANGTTEVYYEVVTVCR